MLLFALSGNSHLSSVHRIGSVFSGQRRCDLPLRLPSLSSPLLLASMGVVERIVELSRHPQAVQEHREFPRHRNCRPFLGVLTAPGGYLLSVAPEVRVRTEWPEDVVGATDQQLP